MVLHECAYKTANDSVMIYIMIVLERLSSYAAACLGS